MRSDVSDTVEHADDRALKSEAGIEGQLQPRAAGEAAGGGEEHGGALPLPHYSCLAFYDTQNTCSLACSVFQRQEGDRSKSTLGLGFGWRN